jgi:hypothetical protein
MSLLTQKHKHGAVGSQSEEEMFFFGRSGKVK